MKLPIRLDAMFVAATIVLLSGCKAFYENAGSRTKVGSVTTPVEVSDCTDSITVKALYSMDGADVYTAKDSLVKIRYRNSYTNDYFAIVKTRGVQDLEVEIEPLDTGGAPSGDFAANSGGDEPETAPAVSHRQ